MRRATLKEFNVSQQKDAQSVSLLKARWDDTYRRHATTNTPSTQSIQDSIFNKSISSMVEGFRLPFLNRTESRRKGEVDLKNQHFISIPTEQGCQHGWNERH